MAEKRSPRGQRQGKATLNVKRKVPSHYDRTHLRRALIFHEQKKYTAQVIARLALRNKLEEFLKGSDPKGSEGVSREEEEEGDEGATDGHNHAEGFAEWDNNDDYEAEK